MVIECDQKTIDRFMKMVDKLPSGCWFWTGARSRGKGNRKWYGTFWVNRKIGRVRAHRFSCEVIGKLGELPIGHDRDHRCSFSLCVNPFECIEYVTKEVNQQRRLDRKRRDKENGNGTEKPGVWLHVDHHRSVGAPALAAVRDVAVRSDDPERGRSGDPLPAGRHSRNAGLCP